MVVSAVSRANVSGSGVGFYLLDGCCGKRCCGECCGVGAEVLSVVAKTAGLRVIVSGALVLGDVVSGDVMLGSALSRATFSEAVALETIVFCLLCRGLLWCGLWGGGLWGETEDGCGVEMRNEGSRSYNRAVTDIVK